MDRNRLRAVLIECLDKLLDYPRLAGLTKEQKAAIQAAKQTISVDDPTVDKILPNVGPYYSEGGES